MAERRLEALLQRPAKSGQGQDLWVLSLKALLPNGALATHPPACQVSPYPQGGSLCCEQRRPCSTRNSALTLTCERPLPAPGLDAWHWRALPPPGRTAVTQTRAYLQIPLFTDPAPGASPLTFPCPSVPSVQLAAWLLSCHWLPPRTVMIKLGMAVRVPWAHLSQLGRTPQGRAAQVGHTEEGGLSLHTSSLGKRKQETF